MSTLLLDTDVFSYLFKFQRLSGHTRSQGDLSGKSPMSAPGLCPRLEKDPSTAGILIREYFGSDMEIILDIVQNK